MLEALRSLAVAAVLLAVAGGPALAQTEAQAKAQAQEELSDGEKIDQCLAAVTNAGSDPRACVGVVADPCLEKIGDGAKAEAAQCMQRETTIWAEHLVSSVKELASVLGDDAPQSLADVQDAWNTYRQRRCAFGKVLYHDTELALVWRATCMLEETGRRAVEIGAILKEARNRGG